WQAIALLDVAHPAAVGKRGVQVAALVDRISLAAGDGVEQVVAEGVERDHAAADRAVGDVELGQQRGVGAAVALAVVEADGGGGAVVGGVGGDRAGAAGRRVDLRRRGAGQRGAALVLDTGGDGVAAAPAVEVAALDLEAATGVDADGAAAGLAVAP